MKKGTLQININLGVIVPVLLSLIFLGMAGSAGELTRWQLALYWLLFAFVMCDRNVVSKKE